MLRLTSVGVEGLSAEQCAGVMFAVRHTPAHVQEIRNLVTDLAKAGILDRTILEKVHEPMFGVALSHIDLGGLL